MITLLLAYDFFFVKKKLKLKWSYEKKTLKKLKQRNLLYIYLRLNNMRSTRDTI